MICPKNMMSESFHVRRDLSPRSMYAPLRVPIKTDTGPFEMRSAFMCPQLVVDVVVRFCCSGVLITSIACTRAKPAASFFRISIRANVQLSASGTSVSSIGIIKLVKVSRNFPLHQGTHGSHNDQHESECADDRRAGWQIEFQ